MPSCTLAPIGMCAPCVGGTIGLYASDSKWFKFCPEIDQVEYEQMKQLIHFDIKSVQKTNELFLRVDTINCLL